MVFEPPVRRGSLYGCPRFRSKINLHRAGSIGMTLENGVGTAFPTPGCRPDTPVFFRGFTAAMKSWKAGKRRSIGLCRGQQPVPHHRNLASLHEHRCVPHAFDVDEFGTRATLRHFQGGVAAQQIGFFTTQK